MRELVLVAAEVVHRGAVEAPPDARERGARHVDLGAFGSFVGTARAADGAVDDVHARLARDDADAARADACIADVQVATFFRDHGVAFEVDGFPVDAHQPVALADDGVGAFFTDDRLGVRRALLRAGGTRLIARDGVARSLERGGRRHGFTLGDAVARAFGQRLALARARGRDGLGSLGRGFF